VKLEKRECQSLGDEMSQRVKEKETGEFENEEIERVWIPISGICNPKSGI